MLQMWDSYGEGVRRLGVKLGAICCHSSFPWSSCGTTRTAAARLLPASASGAPCAREQAKSLLHSIVFRHMTF